MNRALRLGERRTDFEIMPVGQRKKIGNRPLEYFQAEITQAEITNDLRMQQAHGVTRGRVAKTREEFFSHRRATHD